ncbi:MAG TPA: hypothetical protein DDZ51_27890 [Planctomycetaceae bacterium]|nr:hypothetical protein [Planctomycetaceae bacterium]
MQSFLETLWSIRLSAPSLDPAWLFWLLWAEFAAALYCGLQFMLWRAGDSRLRSEVDSFRSRLRTGRHSDWSDGTVIGDVPKCLNKPLETLLEHREHPCRWDQVDAEINRGTSSFRTLSAIVWATATLIGLMLTLVGIMGSMAVLEQNAEDMPGVLRGFRLAFISSLLGIMVAVTTFIVRMLGLNLKNQQARAMVSALMHFETCVLMQPTAPQMTFKATPDPVATRSPDSQLTIPTEP